MWETASIEEVQKELEVVDSDTLVIVDCDDTLIRPKDSILQTAHSKKLKEFMNKITGRQSKDTAIRRYQRIILRDALCLLLSSQWPKILATLQARSVHVLLLSSSLTEDPEDGKNLPSWRYQNYVIWE
jgi:phosphoserine phosphatase